MHIFLTLFVISNVLCESTNNLLCVLFDESNKSIEFYCNNFSQNVPVSCSTLKNIHTNTSLFRVLLPAFAHIKCSGCDNNFLSEAIRNATNLSTIDMSYSDYDSLELIDFNTKSLIKIDASHNQLTEVSSKFFKRISDLHEIDTSFNQFKSIDLYSFKGFSDLRKINMSKNHIRTVHEKAFASLGKLKIVDLSYNEIHSVLMYRFNSEFIVDLHLENNPITEFSCNMTPMMTGVSLFISWSNIEVLNIDCKGDRFRVVNSGKPSGIFRGPDGIYEMNCDDQSFINMKVMWIFYSNLVENISEMLSCFSSTLEELQISENFVGKINETVFQRFTNLTFIGFDDTQLLEFDFNIIRSKHLKEFYISSNSLVQLKGLSAMKAFENLTEFHADNNGWKNSHQIIQNIPSEHLHTLNLMHNYIGAVNDLNFQRFANLKHLWLKNTSLLLSNYDPFEALTLLNDLNISNNNFSNFNFSILRNTLMKLNTLNVANCQIEDISNIVLNTGKPLKYLNLSGNSGKVINDGNFLFSDLLTNLRILNLSNMNISIFSFLKLVHQEELHELNLSKNRLNILSLMFKPQKLKDLDVSNNLLKEINYIEWYPSLILNISNNCFGSHYVRFVKSITNQNFPQNDYRQENQSQCTPPIWLHKLLSSLPVKIKSKNNNADEDDVNINNEQNLNVTILNYSAVLFIIIVINITAFFACVLYHRKKLNEIETNEEEENSNDEPQYEEVIFPRRSALRVIYDRLRFEFSPMPVNSTVPGYSKAVPILPGRQRRRCHFFDEHQL